MPLMATAAMAAVATGCYDSTPDSDLAVLLQPQTSSTVWDSRGYPAPDNGCRRLPLRPIGARWRRFSPISTGCTWNMPDEPA